MDAQCKLFADPHCPLPLPYPTPLGEDEIAYVDSMHVWTARLYEPNKKSREASQSTARRAADSLTTYTRVYGHHEI